MNSPKIRRPSGHERDRRRGRSTPARGRGATCPRSRTSPPAAGTTPMIACSVVDFPAPFGPIRPTSSPAGDAQARGRGPRRPSRSARRARRARASRSAIAPPRPRSRRGRRTATSRLPRISAGVPSASVRPWSSTWIRSQTSITSAMLWSISSTPASWSSRTARTTAANSGTSASGSPAAGSSISTKRGSVASARATPSRRSSPCASAPPAHRARRRARAARAARRPAAAPRAAARPTPSAATSTFSRTVSPRNERLCWNVRAIPARPRRCGLQRVTSRSSSSTVPEVGESKPGEHVHERRLAGAVRADQADDLVPVQLERHVSRAPGRR